MGYVAVVGNSTGARAHLEARHGRRLEQRGQGVERMGMGWRGHEPGTEGRKHRGRGQMFDLRRRRGHAHADEEGAGYRAEGEGYRGQRVWDRGRG